MSFPTILVDANVLITYDVRDILFRGAEYGLCRIRWTDEILVETERNLPKVLRGSDTERIEKATRAVAAMRTAFPGARITGYEYTIGRMRVDPHDRHVAAAAYHAQVDFIVTFNLKHFPEAALRPFNLQVLHPDDFLMLCFRISPGICAAIVRQQARDRIRPARTVVEILAALFQAAPIFATAMRAHMDV